MLAALSVGCVDGTTDPTQPISNQASLSYTGASAVPTRASQNSNTFNDQTDEQLWAIIAARDSNLMVGLKSQVSHVAFGAASFS
jgi:hypothetical protein